MLKLKIKNPNTFIDFLKRFSTMTKQVLLELNGTELKCKNSTLEKNVVKSSSLDLSEIFEVESTFTTELVFIGIINIDRIVNAFKQFTFTEDTYLNINYVLIGDNNVATKIIVESSDLEIEFECASLTMFKLIIGDAIIEKLKNTEGATMNFTLSSDTQNRILSLSKIDSDNTQISFNGTAKGIRVKGKAFNLEISNEPQANVVSILDKKFFETLDAEDHNVYVMDKKILFFSDNNKTFTVIANPNKD